mmetsp:Transcript_14131/g.33856  ORF Transcript_14131/g.33856 Transcript_14131/m.33856 type:complete len:751 (+) Transcript_14131:249-2501(+)
MNYAAHADALAASLIAIQKKQALGKLESVASAKGVDEELVQAIRTDLEQGRVPPIFHALATQTKAFPSSELLHAAAKDCYAWTGQNASFDLGPRASNFETLDILDHRDGAPVKIIDTETWEVDVKSAVAAANLVNQKAEMLGAGVESTKVAFIFGIDENQQPYGSSISARKDALLTRAQSRGVVAQCVDRLEHTARTAAVVGSPGIGKSWLLLYALQQALLYEEAIVLIQASNVDTRYLFIRRNHKVYAWSASCNGQDRFSSKLFHLTTTLVLYDPPEVVGRKGGASFAEGSRQLLAFLSSNEGHDLKKSSKLAAGVRHYLAHPSTQELKVMIPHLCNRTKLSENVVLERASHVGNLPRYLIETGMYVERKGQQDNAIARIESDNSFLLEAMVSGGETKLTDTLPGTLFTVCALRRRLILDEEAMGESGGLVEDFKNKMLVGATTAEGTRVMVTSTKEDDAATATDDDGGDTNVVQTPSAHEDADVDDLNQPEDYDGKQFDYAKRVVSVLTKDVLKRVLAANRKVILSYWGVIDSAQYADMGRSVEELFINDLRSASFAFRRCKLGDDANVGPLQVGGNPTLLDLRNSGKEDVFKRLGVVFKQEQNVIVLLRAGFVLIDCAGPGRRVYQVTVGDDHGMSHNGMTSLLIAAGFLEEDNAGNLIVQCHPNQMDQLKKLEFYWVTAPARFSAWAKKSPKKYSTVIRGKKTAEKKKLACRKMILNRCLAECVVQYALEVPEDPNWLTAKRAKLE